MGKAGYKVFSESPVIDVIGPLVETKKSASSAKVRAGEEVVVIVEAKNVGNRRTKVSMEETVPEWAKLRAGETQGSWVLLPEETATLKYTISCWRAGRFEVPATTVCYRNDAGVTCSADSSPLRISVEGADEINDLPAADEQPTREVLPPGADDLDKEDRDASLFIWALPVVILLLFLIFDRYP